jgi:large subunit ribosomal protein L13
MQQKTYMLKPADVVRSWHLVDANGRILGQVATEVALKLTGRNKKEYTPHVDNGDYVVVINAAKVAVTGRKETNKIYYTHSGVPGGLRERSLGELRKDKPEEIIISAVKNMLPKNKMRAERLKRLKISATEKHAYDAQLKINK